ncbi:Uncharacterised protein [Mycobacteroides abscessus subsp. abscessus]|nr:Uncharacterised protein [Mycobacteroides abscessus subsp. abscessus]
MPAEGWPVVGRAVHAEGVAQERLCARQFLGDGRPRDGGEVGVAPGVVGELDLPGFHQRRQFGAVDGPRLVVRGDEEGEAGAGVAGEPEVGAHHLGAGTVVHGEGEVGAGAGQRGDGGAADGRARAARRGRQQRGRRLWGRGRRGGRGGVDGTVGGLTRRGATSQQQGSARRDHRQQLSPLHHPHLACSPSARRGSRPVPAARYG